jgi:hypothetical protein
MICEIKLEDTDKPIKKGDEVWFSMFDEINEFEPFSIVRKSIILDCKEDNFYMLQRDIYVRCDITMESEKYESAIWIKRGYIFHSKKAATEMAKQMMIDLYKRRIKILEDNIVYIERGHQRPIIIDNEQPARKIDLTYMGKG